MKHILQRNKKLTWLFIAALSIFNVAEVKAQYCVAAHIVACNATTNINDFSITGTTLSNLGTGCTSTTAQAFTIYPPGANTTATLLLGQTYAVNVTCPGNMILSLWIDYDHSQSFDSTEWTQIATTTTANVQVTANITVPANALPGATGLRLRSRLSGNANGIGDACLSFGSGESEDYTVTIDPGVACAGAPVAGTTTSINTAVCPGVNFNLSLAGSTIASGLTYQWQSSSNNISWSNIAGATFISCQTSQTSDTYYQCIVTCNGQSSTSSSLFITTNTFVNCYCSSNATATTGADIDNVTIASLNNGIGLPATSNPASINTYTDFTSLGATNLTQGLTYPISVTQINDGVTTTNGYTTVYIDYNHNGVFDLVDETYAIGQTSTLLGNVVLGNITVPFTALTGNTRMRIVLRTNGSATQSACGTYAGGETEDYLVAILAGTPCVAPPTSGSAVSTFASGCSGDDALISLTGNSIGVGQTYQWQSSPDNVTWTNISGATSSIYPTTITATMYYQCILTCSGQSATSSSVQVILNSPTLCYCVTGLGGASCSATDNIISVEIIGTSLNTLVDNTCTFTTGNTLTAYPAAGSTTAILTRGSSYTLNVTTTANNIISVWIDYDQNGIYDAYDWTQVCTTSVANVVNTVNLDIPWGIPGGQTGMRIRSRAINNPNAGPNACTNFGSGEAEDFVVTIDIGNGVKATNWNSALAVAPNPAKEMLTISFNSLPTENSKLKMMNTNGQLVYAESIANLGGKFMKNIDVSNFAKGIYFIQLITATDIITKKIVVE